MRQHKKTALVLRLAALAVSILLVPAARADGDLFVAELTVAEQPIAGEEALVREETAAAVDTIAAEETLDWRESESAAAALEPPPVCSASADLSTLAIPYQTFAGMLPPAETIIGIASFYDYPQKTASGEEYDPTAFTAAAQLAIRDKFGGIRFGRLYQPAYAVAEYGDKKLIVRFNDVGPLRPGRKFDLSRAAFAYFNDLDKGLLPDFKVTPLPVGQIYPAGPVTDAQLAALGFGNIGVAVATADAMAQAAITPEPDAAEPQVPVSPSAEAVATEQAAITPEPDAAEPEAPVAPSAEAPSISARLYALETALGET